MNAPAALQSQPVPALWLGFEPDGVVRLNSGKVELGQGILTALAQIAAEELRTAPECLRVSCASTSGPNEGHTVGSLSVELSGAAIRVLCACVRQRLLGVAARALEVPVEALEVRSGTVWRDGICSPFNYWDCSEAVLAAPMDADEWAAVNAFEDSSIVGRSFPRIDLDEKIGGHAFIQDLAFNGMLHAAVLRQPFAGAELLGYDEVRFARRHPLVRLVRRACFLACIAETERIARRAMESIRASARWSTPGPPLAIDDDISQWLRKQPSTTTVLEPEPEPSASASAGGEFAATWSRPFIAHASIGLSCAVAWAKDDGSLEIWSHSQGIFALRDQIAKVLDLPPAKLLVHHRPNAGCYGHNAADDVALDAAIVATAIPGRAVRVQWSREEELTQAPLGAAMAVEIRASLDAQKHIARWQARIISTSHGTRPGMHGEPNLLAAEALDRRWAPLRSADVPEALGGGASRNARPLYSVGQRGLVLEYVDSPVRSSAIRALGAHVNVLAIEGMMDELALMAHEDPGDFRRRHLDDPRAVAVLDRALYMSEWASRTDLSESTLGLGIARYKGRGAYCAVVVEIELALSVKVVRAWCAVDAGLVVNPDGARNQIEGGIVQSLSWTTLEAVRFSEGCAQITGWSDYPILRFEDVPQIATEFIGDTSSGSLGVGEASQGPTAAAIANAVSTAVGQRITHLPIDRAQLLRLLA